MNLSDAMSDDAKRMLTDDVLSMLKFTYVDDNGASFEGASLTYIVASLRDRVWASRRRWRVSSNVGDLEDTLRALGFRVVHIHAKGNAHRVRARIVTV